MRGYIGGIVWGVILCGGGLAALSLWSPLAPAPEIAPQTQQPAAPTVVSSDEKRLNGAHADPDVLDQKPISPVAGQPSPGVLGTTADVEAALHRPAVTSGAAKPAQPKNPASLPDMAIGTDSASRAVQGAPAPKSPVLDPDVSAQTTAPRRPSLEDGAGVGVEAPKPDPETGQVPEIDAKADPAPELVVPAHTRPVAGLAPDMVAASAPQPQLAPQPVLVADVSVETPVTPASEAQVSLAPVPAIVLSPAPESTPETGSIADRPMPNVVKVKQLPQTADEATPLQPTIGKRVMPLTDRNRSNPAALPDPQGQSAQPEDLPPLKKYATPFENPENKPVMSIVLIDDSDATDAALQEDFSYPLSIAIDPTDPDAAAKMARHRAAGSEVLLVLDLPDHATASDVEVSLAAGFDILPEAVGLLEGRGIEGHRDLSAQLVAFARDTGRGLVTRNVGLNATQKLAEQDGVPVAAVFRDFGDGTETPSLMRRGVEQAAVRAGQDGGVVFVAHLRADTIEALRLWRQQDRSDRVVLAPVSAVLNGDSEGR